MLWAGSGKVSRFISAGLRVPFGGGNYGLLQYMIDDHWTPETAETAKTPRFSGAANANNYTRNSTLWLKDCFLYPSEKMFKSDIRSRGSG